MIKIEEENGLLAQSLTNLNQRLGVEIVADTDSSAGVVEDSDSDSNTRVAINTRHFQLDPEFAKNYFFITDVMFSNDRNIHFLFSILYFQSKGIRLYLDGLVKIHPDILKTLKSANKTYPLTSKDFDRDFLQWLLKAIFKKDELKACAAMSCLRELNCSKLKFAKGILVDNAVDV